MDGCRDNYISLGIKIKTLRKQQGLTQTALCEGIVTRNMLSKIESGLALPSLSTLCQLSVRLNAPVGYLLDDNDDGSKMKNEALLSMIKKELSNGNYELCLQYLSTLEDFPEDKEKLTASCMYLYGVEKLYNCSALRVSHSLISDALKNDESLRKHERNEGNVYRALVDAFIYSPESGNEENVIKTLKKFAIAPCDLSVFSAIISVISKKNFSAAMVMAEESVFENKGYYELANGIVYFYNSKFDEAKKHLIKGIGYEIPSPIRAYALTVLEKTCAELREFDNAYSYMTMRKELLNKLLKKS